MDITFVRLYTKNELKKIAENFFQELQDTNNGNAHNLPFLIHSLPQKEILPNNCIFQVMVFGGTIFKSAIVNKNGSQIKTASQQESLIPNFSNDEIFLSFINNHLDSSINYLAVNFAFPLSPIISNNLLDGVLIRGGKEHTFIDLVGKLVGKTIAEYILKKTHRKISVTVANDTVCLLLANIEKATWNNTVGGIIGTGTNYAITIENQIINLQSGGFNHFPQTETGKIIDSQSTNPSRGIFEKEVSGGYLFKHFNLITDQNNIRVAPLTSSVQLSKIAANKSDIASDIAAKLLERSASLAACQIAGIFLFKNSLGVEKLIFVMEGNLFWSGWHYKKMLEDYLKLLGMFDSIQFSPVRHSSIHGAIKLLLPVNGI